MQHAYVSPAFKRLRFLPVVVISAFCRMENVAGNLVLGVALVWSAKIVARGMERAGIQTLDHMREHGPHVVVPAKSLKSDMPGQGQTGK